jgi:hypothetical protein
MILIKDLLKETDKIYAERKLGEQCYTVPIALRPVAQSDQVKALAEAMANASNNELSVMKARILELERQLDIKRPVSGS